MKHKLKILIVSVLSLLLGSFLLVDGCIAAIFGFHWWQCLIAIFMVLGGGVLINVAFYGFKKWWKQ